MALLRTRAAGSGSATFPPGRIGIAPRALGRGRSLWVRTILLVAVLAPTIAGARTPGAKITREYDLKAAFLFNFTQFVEWPQAGLHDQDSPFVICVLGDDPFGGSLDEIVSDEKVGSRAIVVRRIRDPKQVDGCQILFIAPTYPINGMDSKALAGREGTLTVGETALFSERSGMIRFVMDGSRVRLRINVEAARAAKLSISSKLLRQAEIVEPGARH